MTNTQSPRYELATKTVGNPRTLPRSKIPKISEVANQLIGLREEVLNFKQDIEHAREDAYEELDELYQFAVNRAFARALNACCGAVGDAIAARLIYRDPRSMRERAKAFDVELNQLSRKEREVNAALGLPQEGGPDAVTPSPTPEEVQIKLIQDIPENTGGKPK